jgi:Double zinc ribbon
MRCPRCGFENPEGLKICGECGAPVRALCPTCRFAHPPRSHFCGDGGAREAPSLRPAPRRCPLSPGPLAAPRPVMRSGGPLPPQLEIMPVTAGEGPVKDY